MATLLFHGHRGSVLVHGVSVATVNGALVASYHVSLGDPFDSQKPVSRTLVLSCLCNALQYTGSHLGLGCSDAMIPDQSGVTSQKGRPKSLMPGIWTV